MNNARNKFIAVFLLMIATTISCKDEFLEVDPTASLKEEEITSLKGLDAQLIGAYSMLSGRGGFYAGSTNWLWGSVLGGEANKGTNSGDQSQVNEIQAYNPQSTNGSVLEKYSSSYEGIARVNTLLQLLVKANEDVPAAEKVRIEAEAKFLRGHYYFELKKLFGDTPYVDENVDYLTGIEKVGNDQNLWPKIEADFTFAATNLPGEMNAIGRANKWAAVAYLGKAYLYQEKWDLARQQFEDVIANGVNANGIKFALMPNYGDLFRISNDNNPEIIFSIQSAANTGTINNANPDFVLNFPYNGGPAGCCGFNQPSFELSNSFRTDVNGLPLLDGSYNMGANQLVTDQGIGASGDWDPEKDYKANDLATVTFGETVSRQYKALTANKGKNPLTNPGDWTQTWQEDLGNLDPRLDHSVGRRGVPYLDHGNHPGVAWIRDQNYGGPYAPKKFIWSKDEQAKGGVDNSSWTSGYSALNFPVIRLADVMLMLAEAYAELGGAENLEKARALVNEIRTRASNPQGYVMENGEMAANYNIGLYTIPWVDQEMALDAIRFERKLELSGEGHRFFDLVRWGIAPEVLNAYLTYEKSKVSASPFVGATFVANKSERMPIPQREIDLIGPSVLKQNPGY